jgi:hypothetical protein
VQTRLRRSDRMASNKGTDSAIAAIRQLRSGPLPTPNTTISCTCSGQVSWVARKRGGNGAAGYPADHFALPNAQAWHRSDNGSGDLRLIQTRILEAEGPRHQTERTNS